MTTNNERVVHMAYSKGGERIICGQWWWFFPADPKRFTLYWDAVTCKNCLKVKR